MPAYGTQQSGVSLAPGDSLSLFSAETLTAPQASISFARGPSPGGATAPTTFEMDFASAPTAVVLIQAANSDVDALYQTLWTSTNTQHDSFTDTESWAFYRAKLSTYSAGGALSVLVKR